MIGDIHCTVSKEYEEDVEDAKLVQIAVQCIIMLLLWNTLSNLYEVDKCYMSEAVTSSGEERHFMQITEEKCVTHNDMQTFLLEPDIASLHRCFILL